MKAVAYYRVSSAQQAENQSIVLQKNRLNQFAAEKGYEILAEHQDDGISGESIESRPGFQDTLRLIASGEIDVLLVFMIDRIGRFAERKDRNRVIELLEDSRTNVDCPYHGFFRWDNEKELNDLEGALNDSRRDNVMRAIRVSEGHLAKRVNGGFSGGRMPYGLRYDKERKKYFKVPQEVKTLRVIFSKLSGGWGTWKTAEFLSQDLEKYPLPKMKRTYRKDRPSQGIKRGDPKPANAWSHSTVRSFAQKDFYFTGIIEPYPAAAKKGQPPVDTGIRLFDEAEVQVARNEMQIRRWRTKSRDIVKTDTLFQGFARCGYCGWKLSRYAAQYKDGKPLRVYYRCRGKDEQRSTGCEFKNIDSGVLDKILWNAFIQSMEDPLKLEKKILKEEFLVDKERADLEAVRNQAQEKLQEIEAKHKRLNHLWINDRISTEQYEAVFKDIEAERLKAEEELEKAKTALRRPRNVKAAVKLAVQLAAEEIKVQRTFEQLLKIEREIISLAEQRKENNQKTETILAELKQSKPTETHRQTSLEEKKFVAKREQLQQDIRKLRLKCAEFKNRLYQSTLDHKHNELLDEEMRIIDALNIKELAISKPDLIDKQIGQYIYQQKRAMFHHFIDYKQGVEIWSKDRFEIHLSIPNEEGGKLIKAP